ncbi:putative spermidine/putrescine transport system ATP-binding protein [Pseudomonas flavescens]|uniref:Spermidine/putrescine import ATP-binding protein PotA n=1 Tax=Phytopseudomonas flavescens TaxID=29435 RepID=A0A1G8H683_9GAMM|nr:ABC transporter ATP-binding protein [Pseudomonas flavescens]SDI02069.1 putative spermidine/putrescine transport system ATP-binding protein [Pseudomonas flavescens]
MKFTQGFESVSVNQVCKNYGSLSALKDVNLDVEAGEFMSLLGPSGSGKTTLLSILGGFIRVSSGNILFGERDVTLMPPHKREIGVVFQNYALFPHMTVGENVAFPLRARGESASKSRARVQQALTTVELGGYEERDIAALSGGQRQRVALARAIVFEPKLILMDEPLSALDKQLRETMQIELRALHKRLGATMIYVTHDQREALTMSDRIAIMRGGQLVQVDTPRRLHDHPADDFVASFIGESTLVPLQRGADNSLTLGGTALSTTRPIPSSGELLLALQAEKLLLDNDSAGPEWNRLRGRVSDIVFQGESLKVFVDLEGGPTVSLRQASHHEGNLSLPPIGSPLLMRLHPEDTIVVPRTSR